VSIGYVIVTFNQASGRPKLNYGGDIYDNDVDALEDATGLLEENRQNGRLERFAVARLEWEHDAEAVSNQDSSPK
jgi:hypothetical protein